MTSNYHLNYVLLLLLGLGAISCEKDDNKNNDNSGDPPEADPLTLDCQDIDEEMILEDRGTGTDYIVPCFIEVTAGLIIEPGVTIAFEQDAGFEFSDYGDAEGYIEAIGMEGDSIKFTGDLKTEGSWRNIVMESEDLRNKMDYCIVEYAGHSDGSESAVYMDDQTKLEVTNTTFRNNKGHGFFVDNSSNIEGYGSNRFYGNQKYPLHIAATQVLHLDGMGSEYTGNTNDQIYVYSNSIYDRGFIEGADIHEWKHPGVPFFIAEDVRVGEREFAHLKIMEGCELIFDEGFGLDVEEHSAVLEILGTPDKLVTLRGTNGQGSWVGIWLNTNVTQNTIENAIITDGGQSLAGHWFDNPANLSLGYSGDVVNLNLTNVEISNSGGCGISETGTINLTTNNVTFSGNVGNDFCL